MTVDVDGGIGLDVELEHAFRTMLRGRWWTTPHLATRLDTTPAEAERLLAALSAEGLVADSAERPGATRAVEPCLALPTLAIRRARERGEPGSDGREPHPAAIARFVATTRRPIGGPGPHVAFAGPDDATAHLERLATTVTGEMVHLVPTWNAGAHEFSRHVAETALRRGVTLRHIWAASVLDHPQAADHAAWLTARWSAPRVTDQIPLRATLVDGTTAILADTSRTGMVRTSTTLDSLTHMADRLWASASPAPAVRQRAALSSDTRNLLVLRLLADGLTDDAIARRIGVSVRTIRNDVAGTMTRLQARSRFQAGVRAVQLGLI